ncbi:MAG: hypothetical protein D6739_03155, partial [Nitrospirae bacterium]
MYPPHRRSAMRTQTAGPLGYTPPAMASLRLDLSRPVPCRRTPAFLFGERRRRWLEWGLAAAAGGVGIAATVLLATGLARDAAGP